MLRRGRFDDVVTRQLILFAEEAAPLLEEADEADRAWTQADRDTSEELFGDFQLVVDAVAQRLLDIRESYALTLDESTAWKYRKAFNRAALKRYRRYGALIED